jgi:hypothetical protein
VLHIPEARRRDRPSPVGWVEVSRHRPSCVYMAKINEPSTGVPLTILDVTAQRRALHRIGSTAAPRPGPATVLTLTMRRAYRMPTIEDPVGVDRARDDGHQDRTRLGQSYPRLAGD